MNDYELMKMRPIRGITSHFAFGALIGVLSTSGYPIVRLLAIVVFCLMFGYLLSACRVENRTLEAIRKTEEAA